MGLDLPTLRAARDQAALSLAELAHDVLPGSMARNLAVEVRDAAHPILMTLLTFEAVTIAG